MVSFKKFVFRLMLASIFTLLLLFAFGNVNAYGYSDLVVYKNNSRTIGSDATYNKVIVKGGGTLYVDRSVTINVKGDFIVEEGGSITYPYFDYDSVKNYIKLILNIDGNATIDGRINFIGLDHEDSRWINHNNGFNGKDLELNVKDNLILRGTIYTYGGKGDDGRRGKDETEDRDATDGEDGGNGGNGGNVTINVQKGNFEIEESDSFPFYNGRIFTRGGSGGDGGSGGYDDRGRHEHAGDGGNGGHGGTIKIKVFNGEYNAGTISYINASGGSGGEPGVGRGYEYDGKDGDSGQITITAKNFNNNGTISATAGDTGTAYNPILYAAYITNEGTINPSLVKHLDEEGPGISDLLFNGQTNVLENYATNDNTINLEWTCNGDKSGNEVLIPASGVRDFYVNFYNENEEPILSEMVNYNGIDSISWESDILVDNHYLLKVVAYDNNNNADFLPENRPYFTFTIDTVPPSVPGLLNPKSIYQNEVVLSWNKSTDLLTAVSYQLQYDDNPITDINPNDNDDGTLSYTLTGLEPNKLVNYKIRAVDAAGNQSDWVESSVVTSPERASLMKDDFAPGNKTGWDEINNCYYVDFYINYVGDNIEEYKVIRKNIDETIDYESAWFEITEAETKTIDNKKYYIYRDNEGLAPHGKYIYEIQTSNSDQTVPIILSLDVPDVVIKDRLPELVSINSPVSNLLLSQKTRPSIDNPLILEMEINEPENDKLTVQSFVLEYYRNGSWEKVNEYFVDSQSGTGAITANYSIEDIASDGEFRWYVRLKEEWNDGFNIVNIPDYSLSDVPKFHFSADFTAPEAPDFTLPEATNNNIIPITITTLDPETEKLEIWESENKKGEYTPPVKLPAEGWINEITLSDDEGKKEIRLIVSDKAGNTTIKSKSTIYDITPPAQPVEIKLTGARNGLDVTWNRSAADEIAGYILAYKRETDSVYREGIFIPQTEVTTGIIEYTIEGLNDNEEVKVRVRGVDKAGNITDLADTSVETGYSLAEKGQISNHSFNPQDYSMSLEILPVKAAQYQIMIKKIGNEVNPFYSEWFEFKAVGSNTYTHHKMEPHASYKYYVITRNTAEEEENLTEDKYLTFEYKVPNQLPTIPDIDETGFKYLNSIPVILRTEGAKDPDGDVLQYFFTLKDDTGNILIDQALSNQPDGMSYQVSTDKIGQTTVEGRTYHWKVKAVERDIDSNGVESDFVPSTVDTTDAVIEFKPEPSSSYVPELKVEVRVEDMTSGLQRIEYYWANDEVIGESVQIPVDSGINEKIFTIEDVPNGKNELYILVEDVAGNTIEDNRVYRLDQTPPVLTDLQITGRLIDGSYYTTTDSSISAEWKVTDENTAIDYFKYTVIPAEEAVNVELLPETSFITVQDFFSSEEFAQVAELELEQNKEYIYVVEAFNEVGLSTGRVVSPGVTIDSTAPSISEIRLNNVLTSGTKLYTSEPAKMTVDVESSDNEGSGIDGIFYALTQTRKPGPGTTWDNNLTELLSSYPFDDGKLYYLAVKAVDKLGQQAIRLSEPLIIDSSAPVVKELIAGSLLAMNSPTDTYQIHPGEPVPVRFLIEDEIGLSKISYSIGTFEGESDITYNQAPETGGWIELEAKDRRQNFMVQGLDVPDTYFVNIKVTNKTRLTTIASSNPVRVDENLAPAPEVYDKKIYTDRNDQLQIYWKFPKAEKEISAYQYQIFERLAGDFQNITGWVEIMPDPVGELFSYTITDLNLTNGSEYYTKIRAVYADNTNSGEGYTDGIIVDNTPPAKDKAFIDDGSFTPGDNLYLKWGAVDEESGIKEYQVKVGTSPGSGDVSDGWIALDETGETQLKNLNLADENGQIYYTTLKIVNGANLITEIPGDGFRVDNSEPPKPLVLDEGRYTSDKPIHLDFNWKWSQIDPESGLKEYQIALLTSREVTPDINWQSLEQTTEVIYDEGLTEGQWYYLAVKSINQAGLVSEIAYSDGILIDTSAPEKPLIKDGTDYVKLSDTDYTEITATFTARDDESDIQYYEYSFGTLSSPESVISGKTIPRDTNREKEIIESIPNNLLFPGEIYFFTVKAINNADLVSSERMSDGLMIVDGYPVISGVEDYGEYTAFNDRITVSWNCTETGYAPMKHYQVYLSTTGQDWTKVKNVREKQTVIIPADLGEGSLTDGSDSFIDGKTYYVSIRGVNAANIVTPEDKSGISDGIKVDGSGPVNLEVRHADTYTTNNYLIDLLAADPDSGITAYRYALGSTQGEDDISGGWEYIETDQQNYKQKRQFELAHNQSYYLSFQARNGTGIWSKLTSDNGVIADLTPPTKPVIEYKTAFKQEKGITDYNYITSLDQINDITWKSKDEETGIVGYRYQVVESKEGLYWDSVSTWEKTGEKLTFNIADLELRETGRYYVAVQTKNRLGVWSETGFSEELLVDTIAPRLIVINHGLAELVTNSGELAIGWTTDEPATVFHKLYRVIPNTEPEFISDGFLSAEIAGQEYIYNFKQNEPATFILELKGEDAAGNEGKVVRQQIRYNAHPEIKVNYYNNTTSVYKGRKIQLEVEAYDPDGDYLEYSWKFGDNTTGSTDEQPEHAYSELGKYEVTVSCTDIDQATTTETINVRVTNTLDGELKLDETWSNSMELLGTVIVPESVKLTIEPGTEVIFPEKTALIVNGGLNVQGAVADKVIFEPLLERWTGIKILDGREDIFITNTIIKNANWGLTIIDRYAELNSLKLTNNSVGLHLINSSPAITNCEIIDNDIYGIKEDGDCSPQLLDNYFENNLTADYYDSELTILTPEELSKLN